MATAIEKLIETHRHGAEVYHGDICGEKLHKLMEEFSMPKGLLLFDEFEDFGFNRTTGFIWLRLKNKKEHKFKSIEQTVFYAAEATRFIENHLSKMTGTKARKLLVTVGICYLLVGVPSPDMIKFATPVGLSRSHPV